MYKVTYYLTESGSEGEHNVGSKWFKTAYEAFEFSAQKGDRVLETKSYPDLEHYPLPDLDMS